MGEKLDVTITYLRQETRPTSLRPAPAPKGVALLRAEEPSISYYRYLYDLVGRAYNWVSRRQMSDADLNEIISDPAVYIYVLYCKGVPAGFTEIDARTSDVAEIRFFGVAGAYHGRGLGRFFLQQVIEIAWSLGPSQVELETCTLDHPAALPLYQKLGFVVIDRRQGQVDLIAE
ncbi:MAG: GNAT family N-acetyltransferase [Pseudomonadota bacterium]